MDALTRTRRPLWAAGTVWHADRTMMFTLLLTAALGRPARADSPCAADLFVDRSSSSSLYFDRRALPAGRSLELTLNELINEVPAHRPILLMDTNPNPDLWAGQNIIAPAFAAAAFPDRTYKSLSERERAYLFEDFFARAVRRLSQDERPVLIIDHHFPSVALRNASTTPLVIDFLTWLLGRPPSFARERLRAAFAGAVIIRDHADADVILASFAARLVTRPDELAHYGALFKRVALFHDHQFVDADATPLEVVELHLAHAWLLAAEAYVPNGGPGAFDRVLAKLPAAFAIIENASLRILPSDPDVVASLLRLGYAPGVDEVWSRVRDNWRRRTELERRVETMLAGGAGVRRVGSILVMEFLESSHLPTSAAVATVLRGSDSNLVHGARTLVVIGRAPGVTHVKMRGLDDGVSFDHVLPAVRALNLGGGGRGGAASLYAPAGRVASVADVDREVDWLLERL